MKFNQKILALVLMVLVTDRMALHLASGHAAQDTDDEKLFDAICPIIYPVDQSASDRGYHYLFYGNGFFINSDGYLSPPPTSSASFTVDSPTSCCTSRLPSFV